MTNAYDRIRYPGQPYGQTHPASLSAFAQLFGLPFASFEGCRMLEIGCGDGVNLINLALQAPGARFVGIDLAEAPIAQARADAAACGCANVEFIAYDLCEIGAAFGTFDYIVAHGVLAWVPEPVRAALMRVIGERLAPHGLAMVSFSALPGARSWQAMRDMLLYETREATSPEDKLRLATEFLERGREHWSSQEADGVWMAGVAYRILRRAPEVLFHDELGDIYAPQMLSDVAAAAGAYGLVYLADTRAHVSEEAWFPSEGRAELRERSGGDWTRFQQQLDFQKLRAFHNAIFARGVADRRLVPSRLVGLWAQGDVRRADPDPAKPDELAFVAGDSVRLTTNDPGLAEFLMALAEASPLALPLDKVAENEALATHVLRLFVSGIVALATSPECAGRAAAERPIASPLARLQAARGERDLATLTQSVLRIEEGPLLALVPLLDGSRDRAALAVDWAAAAGLDEAEARESLDMALAMLARAGALVGEAL
jgi:SAM-dependent methyltransferase